LQPLSLARNAQTNGDQKYFLLSNIHREGKKKGRVLKKKGSGSKATPGRTVKCSGQPVTPPSAEKGKKAYWTKKGHKGEWTPGNRAKEGRKDPGVEKMEQPFTKVFAKI